MAKISFFLDKDGTNRSTPIYMSFCFKGHRIRMSTGEKSAPKYWSNREYRVLSGHPNFPWTNEELDRMEECVKKAYKELQIFNVPITKARVRERINQVLHRDPKKTSIEAHFEKFIDTARDFKTGNTIVKYVTTLNHLKDYCASYRKKLEFSDLDMDFYREFTRYLMECKGHTNNTLVKQIKVLKTFLNWATEEGLNHYMDYKKFPAKETYGTIIFLTQEELSALYHADFKSPFLNNVRDTFLLGCFTGLRYSDIKALRPGNIQGNQIEITIQKTKDRHTVPLNEFAREILQRHSGNGEFCLPVPSNQKMNKNLKKIGKMASIDSEVVINRFKGAKRLEEVKMKWEVLTSHCARKTFITNSINLGMNSEVVMKIANIKSHHVFQRYYDIVDSEKQKEMSRVWNRQMMNSESNEKKTLRILTA